ncbi:MAG: hypothetical protein ACLP0J_10485 [Solirubrobacteraceae bacterium]
MPDSTHITRTISRRARRRALPALLSGVLLAGCGGSSPSSATTTISGASTPPSTTATAGGRGSTGSTVPAAGASPLAFATCMRADGVSNFPDPNPGGGFSLSAGIDPSSPAFRAAQAKCQKILPGGGLPSPGSTTHPSVQTLAKLLKIVRCMRQHNVPQFPDPVTSVPSNPLGAGINQITDFDGAIFLFPSTINLQAPAYKQALTACGAPPLGLSH